MVCTFQPYIKFRRMARAVRMLIGVCHVIRSLLVNSVSTENWFALLDNLVAATTLQQSQKKGRAFVVVVPNEKRQFEQLVFDVNDFKQQKQSKDLFTDEIRAIMKQRPGTRNADQIGEVVRAMKGMSKPFREYPLPIQKQICQWAMYDKYHHNRVILRRGLPPDGIYFVINGTLISKPEGKRNTDEIHAGDKFGEEDLVCGCARRSTVITRHEVELLFLHRFDYMEIFDMAANSNDPKNLRICMQDVVLRHFPIEKLEENPGTWSTLRYRYGRLMVKDSNDVEWIYVILSGEARVIAHLEPGTIDVKARRKEIQRVMENDSPFHRKKKILNFVSDRAYKILNRTEGANVKLPDISVKESENTDEKDNLSDGDNQENKNPNSVATDAKSTDEFDSSVTVDDLKNFADSKKPFYQKTGRGGILKQRPQSENIKMSNGSYTQSVRSFRTNMSRESKALLEKRRLQDKFRNAPNVKPKRVFLATDKEASEQTDLPAFVQVETLHVGQTFGLRSCLEPHERGPSVSLISGDCEVLALNKKFFLRHCDDAMYSLIRLKAKPFPEQSELIDRLDITLQWDEFKQETLKDFLKRKVRKPKHK
ncbi:hypothetical protein FSP39_021438 [Pinctada imbricata]|uniref:Cyclic nucleotide-binding domain-containing protein n=1 Tax=Pinctada imbricata TaxID=66713 RepID=A0AA89C4C5_PINIB|nr:hypothetical protein FSP39_021438 [Pinctada imbricata]